MNEKIQRHSMFLNKSHLSNIIHFVENMQLAKLNGRRLVNSRIFQNRFHGNATKPLSLSYINVYIYMYVHLAFQFDEDFSNESLERILNLEISFQPEQFYGFKKAI